MKYNFFRQTPFQKIKNNVVAVFKNKEQRKHALSVLSVIFLFFSIFIGIFIGLLQSQEVRKKASEGIGKAEIILVPSSTPLREDTLSTVFIRLNTHGEEIDGLQVVFDLLTDTTDEVTIQLKQGNGLQRAWERVESIEGGKKISFAAITRDAYQPFVSNQPVDIAEVTFVAKKPGNMAMVFDRFYTKANRHQQLRNVLKPIIIQEYQIAVAPSPIPSPTPKTTVTTKGSNTSTVSANTTKTVTKGNQKDATSSVTADIVITSTPSAGTGGYGTQSGGICNESCTASTQCGKDFLCYEGQCRLATNLSSTTCQDIAQRSKTCNETCNQAIECKTGLTCFEGSCRDAANPQSQVCQNDQTVKETISQLCGTTCSVNADCGDTLSCHNGQCRLATNPESPSCSDQEVVVKNLGSSQTPTPKAVPDLDSDSSLGLLTQVVIALALTVVVGIVGAIFYSLIRKRKDQTQL
jgi:hypothetical protein